MSDICASLTDAISGLIRFASFLSFLYIYSWFRPFIGICTRFGGPGKHVLVINIPNSNRFGRNWEHRLKWGTKVCWQKFGGNRRRGSAKRRQGIVFVRPMQRDFCPLNLHGYKRFWNNILYVNRSVECGWPRKNSAFARGFWATPTTKSWVNLGGVLYGCATQTTQFQVNYFMGQSICQWCVFFNQFWWAREYKLTL